MQWLYHNDSALGLVYRFAIDPDGELGARHEFIRFTPDWGSPDGMAVDADGGLWIAQWGAGCVGRFLPDGQRERIITLPASQVNNVVFAGPGLDRMFVTSAADGVDEPHGGCLFEVDPGVCGLPTRTFAG